MCIVPYLPAVDVDEELCGDPSGELAAAGASLCAAVQALDEGLDVGVQVGS